jgi:hypothetical protein
MAEVTAYLEPGGIATSANGWILRLAMLAQDAEAIGFGS